MEIASPGRATQIRAVCVGGNWAGRRAAEGGASDGREGVGGANDGGTLLAEGVEERAVPGKGGSEPCGCPAFPGASPPPPRKGDGGVPAARRSSSAAAEGGVGGYMGGFFCALGAEGALGAR
ncbi:hypothetical protein GCM10009540_61290 [Streptomyces turgidiscabies]